MKTSKKTWSVKLELFDIISVYCTLPHLMLLKHSELLWCKNLKYSDKYHFTPLRRNLIDSNNPLELHNHKHTVIYSLQKA